MVKRFWLISVLYFITAVNLAGCQPQAEPLPTLPSSPIPPSPTSPTPAPPTQAATAPTPSPTPRPPAPTHPPAPTPPSTSSPTPTPHPMQPYTIAGLRARDYAGGDIRIRYILEETDQFIRSYIEYPSDGLTITGFMLVPTGPGPFPVIILNHGYYERANYWTGVDVGPAAAYLAQHGYLVLAPDYRSWGESDTGPSFFHTGLVSDVLNLISAVPSLPMADPTRIGVWGHSMGGGITTKVLTVDPRVRAAVLYAPNSADDADLIGRWGPGCLPGQSEAAGDECNPGEVIPAELPPELVAAYLAAAVDPVLLAQISPIHHLDFVTAPVQIHSGSADGATLPQTPPAWAETLVEALQEAGKEVIFFGYEGQGHYFVGPAWEQLMERSVEFFEAHLREDIN